ncbi:MAG: DUF3035 domain-containing protein [Paracoccaceae bacterium]|nr:DUF3035 domain-containing protein [Paracoccaceae bacterium]
MRRVATLCIVPVLLLAGCGDANLRKMRSDDKGPEEFTVVPFKPLEQPSNYAILPEPANVAPNRTDPTPREDAIIALGGTVDSRKTTQIPSSDRELMRRTDRFGTTPSIRDILALEDAQFRRKNNKMRQFQLQSRDPYSQLYKAETLDAFAELQKFLAAGISTPAAPQ